MIHHLSLSSSTKEAKRQSGKPSGLLSAFAKLRVSADAPPMHPTSPTTPYIQPTSRQHPLDALADRDIKPMRAELAAVLRSLDRARDLMRGYSHGGFNEQGLKLLLMGLIQGLWPACEMHSEFPLYRPGNKTPRTGGEDRYPDHFIDLLVKTADATFLFELKYVPLYCAVPDFPAPIVKDDVRTPTTAGDATTTTDKSEREKASQTDPLITSGASTTTAAATTEEKSTPFADRRDKEQYYAGYAVQFQQLTHTELGDYFVVPFGEKERMTVRDYAHRTHQLQTSIYARLLKQTAPQMLTPQAPRMSRAFVWVTIVGLANNTYWRTEKQTILT